MIKRHEQTGLHISRYKIIKFPFTYKYKLTFHGMISIIHLHDHNAYMEIFNILRYFSIFDDIVRSE